MTINELGGSYHAAKLTVAEQEKSRSLVERLVADLAGETPSMDLKLEIQGLEKDIAKQNILINASTVVLQDLEVLVLTWLNAGNFKNNQKVEIPLTVDSFIKVWKTVPGSLGYAGPFSGVAAEA